MHTHMNQTPENLLYTTAPFFRLQCLLFSRVTVLLGMERLQRPRLYSWKTLTAQMMAAHCPIHPNDVILLQRFRLEQNVTLVIHTSAIKKMKGQMS